MRLANSFVAACGARRRMFNTAYSAPRLRLALHPNA